MAKIYKLFSSSENSPTTHSLKSANGVLPLILKYTEIAIEESESIATGMAYFAKNSKAYKKATSEYDAVIMQWVERVHRLGGIAKGLWLVDFDTGQGYLCWAYPEEKVEHFHHYDDGFKNREPIEELPRPFRSKPPAQKSEETSPSPLA